MDVINIEQIEFKFVVDEATGNIIVTFQTNDDGADESANRRIIDE